MFRLYDFDLFTALQSNTLSSDCSFCILYHEFT